MSSISYEGNHRQSILLTNGAICSHKNMLWQSVQPFPVPVKWTSWLPNGTLESAVPNNHGLLCTIIWIKINPKGDCRRRVYNFVGNCVCHRVRLSTAYHITYIGYKVDFNNLITRFRNMEAPGFSGTPVNDYQITCHKRVNILHRKNLSFAIFILASPWHVLSGDPIMSVYVYYGTSSSVDFNHGILSSSSSLWFSFAAKNNSYSWVIWSSRIWSSLLLSKFSPSFFAYFGPFKPSCCASVTAYFCKQKRYTMKTVALSVYRKVTLHVIL